MELSDVTSQINESSSGSSRFLKHLLEDQEFFRRIHLAEDWAKANGIEIADVVIAYIGLATMAISPMIKSTPNACHSIGEIFTEELFKAVIQCTIERSRSHAEF